jgi:hypothetical protein
MFMKIMRTIGAAAIAGAVSLAAPASVASAQQYPQGGRVPGYVAPGPPHSGSREEFRHGEFREFHGHHRYGSRCHHRVSAEGYAHVDFFSGSGGGRKAQLRAIRHWNEQVHSRFGSHIANWDLARGKELRCDRRGAELHCVASAHPCH